VARQRRRVILLFDVPEPVVDDDAIGVLAGDGDGVVRAVESTTTISSAQATEASAAPRSAASFLATTVTESFGTGGVYLTAGRAGRAGQAGTP